MSYSSARLVLLDNPFMFITFHGNMTATFGPTHMLYHASSSILLSMGTLRLILKQCHFRYQIPNLV